MGKSKRKSILKYEKELLLSLTFLTSSTKDIIKTEAVPSTLLLDAGGFCTLYLCAFLLYTGAGELTLSPMWAAVTAVCRPSYSDNGVSTEQWEKPLCLACLNSDTLSFDFLLCGFRKSLTHVSASEDRNRYDFSAAENWIHTHSQMVAAAYKQKCQLTHKLVANMQINLFAQSTG